MIVRIRTLSWVAIVLALSLSAAPALASPIVLAQEGGAEGVDAQDPADQGDQPIEGQEGEAEGQEGQDQPGEEEGQSEPEAETGAGQGETQEAAEEAGPPWTYQMARLGLLMLLGLFLAMGALYYRFVVLRARGEV